METELAYLAGVVDSDGCISVMRRRYSRSDRDYFFARVGIKQVTPEAIELARTTLGGHVYLEKQKAENRRPMYRWEASSREAGEILKLLVPHLRIKRKQALNCIELCDARGVRTRKGVRRGLAILTLEEEASFRRFYERSLVLNRVGVHDTTL